MQLINYESKCTNRQISGKSHRFKIREDDMEHIFNFFYFCTDRKVTAIGVRVHHVDGDDQQKVEFLKSMVESDSVDCELLDVPGLFLNSAGELTQDDVFAMMRLGTALNLFDSYLNEKYPGICSPLYVLTPFNNGQQTIDISLEHGPMDLQALGVTNIQDYLIGYTSAEGFDLPRLLHDDFYHAIKLLYNNKLYVSHAKLMMSFIDSVGYLEFGDVPRGAENVFVRWLKNFSDVYNKLGVTPEELWEFRNSVLHMTNLDSKKVVNGNVRRLSILVSQRGTPARVEGGTVYFNLTDLIYVVQDALEKWFITYNQHPEKWTYFIQRYDKIVSDIRWASS